MAFQSFLDFEEKFILAMAFSFHLAQSIDTVALMS
jgi:hypothetical protein